MTDDDDFHRLPGLYRRWEVAQLLEPETDHYLEPAGVAGDGTPLVAVYRRDHHTPSSEGS